MSDLLKGNAFNTIEPYKLCSRVTDFNLLDVNQYICISEEFESPLKFNTQGSILKDYSASRYRKVPGLDIFKFNNLTLFGHGMLCSNDNKVLVSNSLHIWPERLNSKVNHLIYDYDKSNSLINIKCDLKKRFISGVCIPMSRAGEGTYGHWLVDFIPRLLILKSLGITGKYIFTDLIPDYSWEFFKLLGIDESEIITYNPLTECVELEQAYVPTYLRLEDQFSPLIAGLPRFFSSKSQIKGCKIYVARGDFRKNQKVLNNKAVIELLLKYGYEIVYPHEFSIKEQIDIFSQASVVVGEYGSAMHNTFFCHPGTKVIVLQSNQILSMIQTGLGNALSHQTEVLFCDSKQHSINPRSFLVDIELLASMLKKLNYENVPSKESISFTQKFKHFISRKQA